MKTARLVFVMAALMAATIRLSANAPMPLENIIITRTWSVTQTGAGMGNVNGASATPFSFQANTEGDGSATATDPLTGATVTLPNSTSHGLIFDSGAGKWRYTSGNYADANAMATAGFADGTYAMSLAGSVSGSENITLSSIASSTLLKPVLNITSTGGSWGGGVFTFTPGQDINISFGNISSGASAGGGFHYDFSMNGTNTLHDDAHEPNAFVNATEAPPNFVIDTSAFQNGTYTIEVGYGDIQSINTSAYGSTYLAAGLYEIRSTITLMAVPEPSAYAAIFGVLALAGGMLRRRRQVS